MEHKRKMERIIELLSGKVKTKTSGRNLNKKPEREEEYTIKGENDNIYQE